MNHHWHSFSSRPEQSAMCVLNQSLDFYLLQTFSTFMEKNLSFISALEHHLQTLQVYPTLPQYNTETETLNKETRSVDSGQVVH